MTTITSLPLSAICSIIERNIIQFTETTDVHFMGMCYPATEETVDDNGNCYYVEKFVAYVSVSGSTKFPGMNGEHKWDFHWDSNLCEFIYTADLDQKHDLKDAKQEIPAGIPAENHDKSTWPFKNVKLSRKVYAIKIDGCPYDKVHYASLDKPAISPKKLVERIQEKMKEWEGDINIPYTNAQLVISGIEILPNGLANVIVEHV